MNDADSIIEFFYNIVPGVLFLALLEHLYDLPFSSWFKSNQVLLTFAYIAGGLFFGFVFQGLTKISRELFELNNRIAQKVVDSNSKFIKLDEGLKSHLKKDVKLEEIPIEQKFYLMDNFLRGKQAAFMPTHNSARFAFWSNIFFATLILMILTLTKKEHFLYYFPWFAVTLIFSWKLAKEYFYAFFDTILKSFFMSKSSS